MKNTLKSLFFSATVLFSCTSESNQMNQVDPPNMSTDDEVVIPEIPEEPETIFFYGADLSYVNEMEDCGADYFDFDGTIKDPYQIFAEQGTNLVRVRLWHTPDWTAYSNLEDVKKSIKRAKDLGMHVLLDFHYSDTWADPSKQQIPAAWLENLNNTEVLGQQLYDYTYATLEALKVEGLLPDIVQVGNEINAMLLQDGEPVWPIDWNRNALLINKGILAVRDIAEKYVTEVEVMLHIAQPENGLWWFDQASENGITDYDWIGLSYYPQWSEYQLNEVGTPLKMLIDMYSKKLMVVETAYPFTLTNLDAANNILGENALLEEFNASPDGQLGYLMALKEVIENAGGQGLVYWEPAWVSTNCETLWGKGSHWDNATLFDQENKAHNGLRFYNEALNN